MKEFELSEPQLYYLLACILHTYRSTQYITQFVHKSEQYRCALTRNFNPVLEGYSIRVLLQGYNWLDHHFLDFLPSPERHLHAFHTLHTLRYVHKRVPNE